MVDRLDYSPDVEVDDGLAAKGGFEEGKVIGMSWSQKYFHQLMELMEVME